MKYYISKIELLKRGGKSILNHYFIGLFFLKKFIKLVKIIKYILFLKYLETKRYYYCIYVHI